MFKTELPRIYFRPFFGSLIGALKTKRFGKKERNMRKKRQRVRTSTPTDSVEIFSAVQPPPHSSMATSMRKVNL